MKAKSYGGNDIEVTISKHGDTFHVELEGVCIKCLYKTDVWDEAVAKARVWAGR